MLTELYKLIICTSDGSDCLQKRFDGILFSSSIQYMCSYNSALSTEDTWLNSACSHLRLKEMCANWKMYLGACARIQNTKQPNLYSSQ